MQTHSALAPSGSLLDNPERIIAAYRGWEAFERAHGGPDIIDFDLTRIGGETSFNSRREVLAAFEELHGQLGDGSNEGEFLRDKLQGSIFYLRALMGEQIPFDKYVRGTLGIAVEPFPDGEIDDARDRVNELLSHFGLAMERRCRDDFESEFIIRDPEEIKRGIVGQQDYWIGRLREAGIPNPEKLDLRVEFTEVDAYWSNWISGSAAEGIRLRINLHPRKRYDLGKPLALCLHEICGHAVQMAVWAELIARGAINQACGLTTVHSPESFLAEGLGQTVADLLGDEAEFPVEFRLSRWLQYYTLTVLHNAHLMLYECAPIEEVLRYAQSRLPFSPAAVIESELHDRGTDPLYKSYQLSYAAAEYEIRGLIRNFTPQQRRRFFVEMYTRPMTPKQLHALGRQIGEDPPDR